MVHPNGVRCKSKHQLEIDHINPVCHGGDNQKEPNSAEKQIRLLQEHGYGYILGAKPKDHKPLFLSPIKLNEPSSYVVKFSKICYYSRNYLRERI